MVEKSMNILIVGLGEVGSALFEIMKPKWTVQTLDKKEKKITLPIDVMHICYPYTPSFVEITFKYMERYDPKLTLIESTVKPETTQKIYEKAKKPICHSPVRGRHIEGLEKGLFQYTKFIGPVKRKFGLMAEKYYNSLGIKTLLCSSPLETEYMKLLNGTYFALMISFFQEIRRICEENGLNESEILQFFTTNTLESYYQHMRPTFHPSVIRGHCIIPNVLLLNQAYPMELADAILNSNERRKKEVEE